MYTKKQREQYNFNRAITCQELELTTNQYNWLRRKGEELRKIYEASCNGELTDDKYDEMTGEIEFRISKYLSGYPLFIFYQTDPRGATIYLSKEPIADNNYNRSGSHCIY